MAQPARVLHQQGGSGPIVFAGQQVPALAIRADALRGLHDLAKTAMQHAIDGDCRSDAFRHALQTLHQDLATMMLDLQDAGHKYDVPVPLRLRVGSGDFLVFDDSEAG